MSISINFLCKNNVYLYSIKDSLEKKFIIIKHRLVKKTFISKNAVNLITK